ncbi:MAG: phage tail family protein, partial [Candidatus Hydrogenedentes bacterium]|nr:phage tail family protein [Candidatus Hydrogenedentota bacterium]
MVGITVGSYVFDGPTTSVKETYAAVGGKETRVIVLTGLLRGATDQAELDAGLDAFMAAASADSPVYVSLRLGRRILARRVDFSRELSRRSFTGHFVLTLEADGAYEESELVNQTSWSIVLSGATVGVTNSGNAVTYPVVTLEALGTIIAPQLSDGLRTLAYDGLIEAGSTLVFDGELG